MYDNDYEDYTDDLNDWETEQVYHDMALDRDYEAERNAVVESYDVSDRVPEDDYDVLCCEFCGIGMDPADATDVVTPEGHLVACKACIASGVQNRVRGPVAPPKENE